MLNVTEQTNSKRHTQCSQFLKNKTKVAPCCSWDHKVESEIYDINLQIKIQKKKKKTEEAIRVTVTLCLYGYSVLLSNVFIAIICPFKTYVGVFFFFPVSVALVQRNSNLKPIAGPNV